MSGDVADLDLGLFGVWGDANAGAAGIGPVDRGLADAAWDVILEVKSVEARQADIAAADDMRPILNAATLELKEQFETFRGLRAAADAMLSGGDEAAQKQARADIKAAIDAMSLIVRTLEKVDTLQRQFARDRQIQAERVADEGGYQEALREVERLIEERAEERAGERADALAQERYRQRCLAAGLDPGEPGCAAGDGAPPPDTG
jgi:hypothetical protein